MYTTVRRIGLVKKMTWEGSIISSFATKHIQGPNLVSGKMKQVSGSSEEKIPEDVYFSNFLSSRLQEASKSLVIKIQNLGDWKKLYRFCSAFGVVVKMYHYNISTDHFILVEMSNADQAHSLIQGSENNSGNMENLKFSSHNEFGHFQNCKGQISNDKINCVLQEDRIQAKTIKSVLQSLKSLTISDQINEIYQNMKVNDLGIRLRFLTCKQIQRMVSGIMTDALVYPFGSSVTGLGHNGCDLDLVIIQNLYKKTITTNMLKNVERTVMQTQLEVISDIIKFLMPGCSRVQYIRQARVPIVKYKHEFTGVDCDLSMYCNSGVQMSQLLFIILGLDERVKPLVFMVRLWARVLEITIKQAGPNISNFSLTLLVVFFLQQRGNAILPCLNNFTWRKNLLISNDFIKSILTEFMSQKNVDKTSLAELLLLFFNFYSNFDFKNFGCCVKTGKIINKIDHNPLYIKNPIDPELNVSRNVSFNSLLKFQELCKLAYEILECSMSSENPSIHSILWPEVYCKWSSNQKVINFNKAIDVSNIFQEVS